MKVAKKKKKVMAHVWYHRVAWSTISSMLCVVSLLCYGFRPSLSTMYCVLCYDYISYHLQ